MPANTTITIGGVDHTALIDLESIEVDNNVVMTNDTMTFNEDIDKFHPEVTRPKDGNEVVWTVNGSREFGGVISQVEETDLGTQLEYQVSCQSYERWLNRHLVVNFYDEQNADDLVRSVIQTFTHGFTTSNVQPGFSIPPRYFNYIQVSDAIKDAAEEIGFGWYVDYYKDIHFYPVESFVSPLPNNVLDADNDVDNYGDLVITEDGTQKKNRVYVKGFKARVATPVTLTFTGDGNTKQWSLGYRPSRAKGDVTVTVGGTALTVKRDLVEGFPGQNTTDTSSAYLNYNQILLRLNYAPAQGVQIVVQMYYLASTIIMRQDPHAQATAATADGDGSDGRYEYAVTEPSLSQATIDAANARGDQILMKYKNPELSCEFTSYTYGWRAGQYFVLTSKYRMGGINKKMYIQQVKKTLVYAIDGGVKLQYDITASSVPYLAT